MAPTVLTHANNGLSVALGGSLRAGERPAPRLALHSEHHPTHHVTDIFPPSIFSGPWDRAAPFKGGHRMRWYGAIAIPCGVRKGPYLRGRAAPGRAASSCIYNLIELYRHHALFFPSSCGSGREPLPPFGPAAVQHASPVAGSQARPEAVAPLAYQVGGLVGTLDPEHWSTPLSGYGRGEDRRRRVAQYPHPGFPRQ